MAVARIFVTGWYVADSSAFYVEVWEFHENGTGNRLANAYVPAGELEIRAHDLARRLRSDNEGVEVRFPLLTAVLGVMHDAAFSRLDRP